MADVSIRKKDVFWVYTSRFLTIGVNLLLLPLIMKFLGEEELGLWYVFSSISQVVNLFDFGFNSTISRHMTYAWSGAEHLEKTSVSTKYGKEINVELVSEIIHTCRFVYLLISGIALIVMLTVGTGYIYAVTGEAMNKNILFSWIVYMFSVFLNMFYGYWASLLQGIGAVEERSRISVYSKFIQIIVATVLILNGMGLLGFVISYFLSGVVLRFLGKHYFDKRTEGLSCLRKIEFHRIRECFTNVWGTAWKDGIVMLAQYLSTQANTLICAYYIDLASTSIYGIMTQIVSIISSIATSYFTAYQPAFSSACLRKEMDVQKKIICITVYIYKGIFLLGSIALFVVGIPILKIIRPNIEIGFVFSLLLCLFYYFFSQKDLFASMIASFNEIPYWKSYVITALATVAMSVLLIERYNMGIYGLVMAQLITNLVYNCWKWPLYLMRKTKVCYLDIYHIGFDFLKNKTKNLFIRM